MRGALRMRGVRTWPTLAPCGRGRQQGPSGRAVGRTGLPEGAPRVPATMPSRGLPRARAWPTIRAMIHDVDELLERSSSATPSTARGSSVAFDAPTKRLGRAPQRPDRRPVPVRHPRGYASAARPPGRTSRRATGRSTARRPPPRRFKLSYSSRRGRSGRRTSTACCRRCCCASPHDALLTAADLKAPSPSRTCRCPIDVALPPPEDRSLADVWSALGGELKPSLDLVVTAPIIDHARRAGRAAGPRRCRPLGVASTAGPTEVGRGRGRRMVAATEQTVEQDERLPASAGVGDPKKRTPGIAIRVRGLRTR